MKINLILLMIIITVGCSNEKRYSDVLSRADSIVETKPDSALTVLDEITDTAALGSDANRALYYLLLTQAQHKCYKPTTVDGLLDFSIAYYNKVGDNYNLARSYYYRAMPLYERGCRNDAIEYLKKGEHVALNINNDKLLSKYYESLYMVNRNAGYDRMMLRYAKLFLESSLSLGDNDYIIRGYTHVAIAYEKQGLEDSTNIYLMRCKPLLNKVNKSDHAMALANIGFVYHDRGDYNTAKRYLLQSLKFKQRGNALEELAEIYYNEGNIVEAKKMWGKIMLIDDVDIKISTMKTMIDYHLKQKDFEAAYRLSNEITHLSDSLNKSSDNIHIAELQLNYDNKKTETELYKTITFILSVLIILLAAIFVISYYYRRHAKILSDRIKTKDDEIAETELKIKEMEKADEKSRKEMIKLKTKIKEKPEQLVNMVGQGKIVYDRIKLDKKLPNDIPDSEKCLVAYYLFSNNNLCHTWTDKYGDMTSGQMIYLILQDMGYSDDEMAEILNVSSNAIRVKKHRLKQGK